MKKTLYTLIPLLLISPLMSWGQAQQRPDLKKDFSTLGDNESVIERVKNLDSQQKVRVVQNRLVDRNNRLELGLSYAWLGGGDSYVQTQNVGTLLAYHISPRWSLGLEYHKSFNSLTQEGENVYSKAWEAQSKDNASSFLYPAIDYAINTSLATVSFYPIYGKLNLFDFGIAQFDVYVLGAYGKKNMSSGSSDVYGLGLGAGIWLNQLITSRFEVRYEEYKDLLLTNMRKQNSIQAMATIGILIW